MKEIKRDLVIVGAGASGMAAAVAAAEGLGAGRVLLLEKHERPGRKLLATGNGRCNFTNMSCTARDFSSDFPAQVMEQLPPRAVVSFFSKLGVTAREEEEGRVYPYSGQGACVCQALVSALDLRGVELRCNSVLKKVEREGGGFLLSLSDGTKLHCKKLILSVGGKAGCQYGSEGDGYSLAGALGHTVVKPIPALVQLTAEDSCFSQLKGVRARAKAGLYLFSQLVCQDEGEVQFTETGLSGICIFNLSRYLRYTGNPLNAPERYTVQLDFLPEQSPEETLLLLRHRQEDLKKRPARLFLDGLLHHKLAPVILDRAGISKAEGLLTEDITGEQLQQLAQLLRGFGAAIIGTKSWKEAQVTAGGVSTLEIHPVSMESKLVSGLYFSGELIDVDGPCGGYNLQWAFASGYVAGSAAAEALGK